MKRKRKRKRSEDPLAPTQQEWILGRTEMPKGNLNKAMI
jgi:hypothetical protein